MPGYPSASGGSGQLRLRNAEGSVSSLIDMDDILAGMASADVIGAVSASPDNRFLLFQFQRMDRVPGGSNATPTFIGPLISAVNGLHRFVDGLKLLSAESSTPSVAVDWDALYGTFASGENGKLAVPELSAQAISVYGGVVSGLVLDRVSADGYDVGDTLCSLVSGLSAANDKIRRTLSTHIELVELEHNEISTIQEIVAGKFSDIDWEDGDIIVIKKKLYADGEAECPYQHEAYVYAGDDAVPQWYAMDGTYSADSVVFGDDITLAGAYTSVGNVKISDGVLSAKGKTVKWLFDEIFDKTIQPLSATPPAVTGFRISMTDKEVGSTVNSVPYTITVTPGKYVCPWNGSQVNAKAEISVDVFSGSHKNTHVFEPGTASYSDTDMLTIHPGFTFMDNTVLSVGVSASYGEGEIAKDNKGNDSDPPLRLQPGHTAMLSGSVKSYRNYFWGSHKDWQADINCNSISTLLPNKSGKAARQDDTFKINILSGDKRAAFAYPADSNLCIEIKDDTSFQNVTGAFKHRIIQIGGVDRNEQLSDYNLLSTAINADRDGATADNTYTVKFIKVIN